jgi:hypothetical protein
MNDSEREGIPVGYGSLITGGVLLSLFFVNVVYAYQQNSLGIKALQLLTDYSFS